MSSFKKPATTGATATLAIVSGIWLILEGILFIVFDLALAQTWTQDLTAPFNFLYVGINGVIVAVLLTFICAAIIMVGGTLIFMRKYYIGGLIVIGISIFSIICGGGFWVSVLWGTSAGLIAFICPKLEHKIKNSK
ncbi:MAG: hypothetical protein GF329_12370 [Candidatus Lokiarchaeota archaeon]|nr:hypothetical protein [Candidatus Lokiarchaeota archaeon]